MKLLKLGIISLFTSSALFAGTYNVDTSHSSVGFSVKHMMISNVKGTFDAFKGSFEYDEKTDTLKALHGEVEVKSINTSNKKRDDHLRSSDFFAADKYPQITFKLHNIKGDKAYGTLTMRGVSKEIALDLETSGTTIKDPWGNTRTGLSLNGKINRFDYEIKYNSLLEAGGVAIGEDVKINIEIEGILKK